MAMMAGSRLGRAALVSTMLMAGVVSPAAQMSAPLSVPPPTRAGTAAIPMLKDVGVDQKPDSPVPLDTPFVDEAGKDVTLAQYFSGTRPVVLILAYYECPMLCTQVLNGLVSSLGILSFDVGREFDVVAVSFNPSEGPGLASQKKAAFLERYKRPQTAQGWHFLTGTQASIDALTKAIGFRYAYDERIGQYAHGAGIELLTPQGVLAKYFYGIEFSTRDIRLGLIEASSERIGTPIDDVLLLCYHYDPATGAYGAVVLRMVRVGGIATMLAVAVFLTVSLRRERAAGRAAPASRT